MWLHARRLAEMEARTGTEPTGEAGEWVGGYRGYFVIKQDRVREPLIHRFVLWPKRFAIKRQLHCRSEMSEKRGEKGKRNIGEREKETYCDLLWEIVLIRKTVIMPANNLQWLRRFFRKRVKQLRKKIQPFRKAGHPLDKTLNMKARDKYRIFAFTRTISQSRARQRTDMTWKSVRECLKRMIILWSPRVYGVCAAW